MPVTIYIGRDKELKVTMPPAHNGEMKGVQDICDALHDRFGGSKHHFAVLVSPQHAGEIEHFKGDMVIITEEGLGVLELKDYPGTLHCYPRKKWFMDGNTSGKKYISSPYYINPHKQVQHYGSQIWKQLTKSQKAWLPGSDGEKVTYKLQTAVCFTHINARIEGCQEKAERWELEEPWERDFSVLPPNEVPDWTHRLRFEAWPVDKEKTDPPYTLTAVQIESLAVDFFGCKVWPEMMEGPRPYAYLKLIRNEESRQIFRLTREHYVIGRDAESCNLLLPELYENISRKHATLTYKNDTYYIEDAGSMNGSSVNDVALTEGESKALQEGDMITLGDEFCSLQYSKSPLPVGKSTLPVPKETVQISKEKLESDFGISEDANQTEVAAPEPAATNNRSLWKRLKGSLRGK